MERNIEEIAAEFLLARRKELGISADALGRKVYPDAGNARMKVQSLTQKQGNGKVRAMRLSDFIAICEGLELDPVRALCRILDQRNAENN